MYAIYMYVMYASVVVRHVTCGSLVNNGENWWEAM